jgi:hypothetical protein
MFSVLPGNWNFLLSSATAAAYFETKLAAVRHFVEENNCPLAANRKKTPSRDPCGAQAIPYKCRASQRDPAAIELGAPF